MVSLASYLTFSIFLKTKGDKMVELELKELFTRYASDVIATTAFGLQVDSFKDPENIFFRMGTKTINFTQGWGMLRMIVLSFFPFIAKVNTN